MDKADIGKFIDAAVNNQQLARTMLRDQPELLNARWALGETTLHFLAVEGYTEAVRFLAEAGVPVDAVNELEDTALVDVAVLGQLDIAKILLEHGANPNATSRTRDTVLQAAVRSGNVELVELLLDRGASSTALTEIDPLEWEIVLPSDSAARAKMESALARRGITRN